jgi:hypothetical protein
MLTMKKAKIILTAVGILAIVGGAAAFQSQKSLDTIRRSQCSRPVSVNY